MELNGWNPETRHWFCCCQKMLPQNREQMGTIKWRLQSKDLRNGIVFPRYVMWAVPHSRHPLLSPLFLTFPCNFGPSLAICMCACACACAFRLFIGNVYLSFRPLIRMKGEKICGAVWPCNVLLFPKKKKAFLRGAQKAKLLLFPFIIFNQILGQVFCRDVTTQCSFNF